MQMGHFWSLPPWWVWAPCLVGVEVWAVSGQWPDTFSAEESPAEPEHWPLLLLAPQVRTALHCIVLCGKAVYELRTWALPFCAAWCSMIWRQDLYWLPLGLRCTRFLFAWGLGWSWKPSVVVVVPSWNPCADRWKHWRNWPNWLTHWNWRER